MLQSIKIGSTGEAVADWQYFLLGRGFYAFEVQGVFDTKTDEATKKFQKKHGLNPDGWVGTATYGVALGLGFDPLEYDFATLEQEVPPPPAFKALSVAQKIQLFGEIKFKDAPTKSNPEAVTIINGWEANITRVSIPQLVGVSGAGVAKTFSFHKKVADQVQRLFAAWEKAGHKSLILSYEGSWVPRYVRGSRTTLSSHAWGTAFDINAAWNARGSRPALVGKRGSVRELVTIAYEHGFYWGGYFKPKDGMHFEVAKLL